MLFVEIEIYECPYKTISFSLRQNKTQCYTGGQTIAFQILYLVKNILR